MALSHLSEHQVELLQKWQVTSFELEDTKDNYKKADSVRCLLAHLEYAAANKIASQSTCGPFKDLLEQYAEIVDSQNPETGINNYAEGALKLAESCKNESQKWKSQLNAKILKNEAWFQKCLSSNKTPKLDTHKDPKIFAQFMRPSKVRQQSSVQSSSHQAVCINSDLLESNSVRLEPSKYQFQPKHQFLSSQQTNQFEQFQCTGQVSSVPSKKPGFLPPPEPVGQRDRNYFSTAKDELIQQMTKKNSGQSIRGRSNFSGGQEAFETGPSNFTRQGGSGGPRGQNFHGGHVSYSGGQESVARGQANANGSIQSFGGGGPPVKKSLGARRGPNSKFVSPLLGAQKNEAEMYGQQSSDKCVDPNIPDALKNIEPQMIERIKNEIMDSGPPVVWEDIAGLEFAKATIKEIVVWPMLRPDIFKGLRGPPKGILLFGPPGTGKTLIGKCIASQSGATFFSISASSLTSKWIGEGEKMVRALFAVARCHQPAVIFIDEIDSLLTQRSEQEHESSRRLKTEFLVQLDGATTCSDERILVVGATNRPQELDEAARRRLVKRLYIPLPEFEARRQIIDNLLKEEHELSPKQLEEVCKLSEGYSGADVSNLCREAALGPIRSLSSCDIQNISVDKVRSISYQDFMDALHQVKASVSQDDLKGYIDWNGKFGCGSR